MHRAGLRGGPSRTRVSGLGRDVHAQAGGPAPRAAPLLRRREDTSRRTAPTFACRLRVRSYP
eukprot:scaffold2804_cov371-Prasinococcus_capsulatus_cf.AAC.20